MDKVRIIGGNPLHGTIPISGAKNAALPLMAASLLTKDPLTLSNVPHLVDIATMTNLLIQHGTNFTLVGTAKDRGYMGEVIRLQSENITVFEAPYDIVRKMRASVLVLGPLLARFGKAKVSLPGGCAIGPRPIDMHLKALELMGATVTLNEGYINATTKGRLKGADIHFDKVSVGATENAIMAATLADGVTTIRNAAKEPEVTDLVMCLKKMGAIIEGVGSDTLTITGIDELHGTNYDIIPDRIESGSYLMAAAITGGEVTLVNTDTHLIQATIEKLQEADLTIDIISDTSVKLTCEHPLKSVNATTQPFPGYPTDMQAQLMALMTVANGTSIITENIFENRFMHASELVRMGADITIEGHTAIIRGTKKLKGAQIMATDLRASVSLVIAALAAKGETIINRMYHIDRGYERIEEKLAACGAHIERIKH